MIHRRDVSYLGERMQELRGQRLGIRDVFRPRRYGLPELNCDERRKNDARDDQEKAAKARDAALQGALTQIKRVRPRAE